MFQTNNSIIINRPPQEVFDALTNPDKLALWQSMTESVEISSNGDIGVGSSMKIVSRFLGRKFETELEVTAWEPPYRFGWKNDKPYPSEVTNILEPQGEGTLLTNQSQGEMGSFYKLAEGLVARMLEKQIDANIESLKLYLESVQI
jgi:uncharacterized protein YndB with AHSA1/START domain